jgi:hypothetical protein
VLPPSNSTAGDNCDVLKQREAWLGSQLEQLAVPNLATNSEPANAWITDLFAQLAATHAALSGCDDGQPRSANPPTKTAGTPGGSAPNGPMPPAGGGAPPPLPPIALNPPPQYPPAQPPPGGGSTPPTQVANAPPPGGTTQKPTAPPQPPPAQTSCSAFPGAKSYTCTRTRDDGSPDVSYHCLYPDAVPEAQRICGQASEPKYAGKWAEGGGPPPSPQPPPKVYADLNLKPPATEVQACESKPPFLPWGGHGSATITVSGGKPCGIGWHDTGATILDSMSVSSSPSHGSLKPQDQHVIVFTPAPGYKGQDSFTLSMKEHNGGRRATMSVKVSVTIQ